MAYTLNKYGLRDKDMQYMLSVFGQESNIQKVIIYGSRAKATNRLGSDIDLALCGAEISNKSIGRIHYLLEEESPTLLWFDVCHFDSLSDTNLKKQILEHGQVIYERIS